MPTVDYKMTTPGPSASGSSDRPADVLPTLAGVYRLQDEITLGFAALGTAGMGVDYEADPNGARLMSSYLNGRVAPAVAYRVNDRLAVGFAANLMFAQMSWEMGRQPKVDAGNSFGYGATVGVTFKANQMVTIGAAYETKSFFQDFKFKSQGMDFAIDLDQPQVATLGAAVRPVTGLVVALDGQWINWSDVMGKNLPKFTTAPAGAPTSFDMRWSDQLVVKVGAEYALPALAALKVRAGYNYGATPLDEKNFQANMMFPAVAEHHVTVGAGYDLGKLALNAAVVYSPESSIKTSPAPGVEVESKMSQLAFELGGAYRF
jgi:long-chain fatty acid transport protein